MGEIEKIMADAVERVRREGYTAGWRDAVSAIVKAAQANAPGELPPIEVPEDLNAGGGFTGNTTNTSDGAGPAIGTIPHYVLAEVKRRAGSTGADIVASLSEQGHKFAEPQIRTNLKRLADKNLIVNRHKKWFPK